MYLMVIRHRGAIDLESLDIDILAAHDRTGDDPRDTVSETLVAVTLGEAMRLAELPGVITVELAQPGRFSDDTEGAVLIHQDGSYAFV